MHLFRLAILAAAAALTAAAAAARAGARQPVLAFSRKAHRPPRYITSSSVLPGAINIHLQPHSHDDVGWLKTFDEYLIGRNGSQQQVGGVQFIYDGVVQALARDSSRTFTAVEMGFFMRWFEEAAAPEDAAAAVELVQRGSLVLSNAGWCMADEAVPTFADMADNLALGHRLVARAFGANASVLPRVGWQIDPFGHSAAQGSLFTSGAGFSAMFYGRLDMEERAARIAANATEYIWRPSRSLGAAAQSFAGFNIEGYDPPRLPNVSNSPFHFDVTQDTPTQPAVFGPVQDNPDWDGENTREFVAAVLEIARVHSAYILPDEVDGTVNLAWQMGTDFNYIAPIQWFHSLDRLIHYVNLNTSIHNVNLLYSTPQGYADAKLAQRTSWPLKLDDQFPYWGDTKHWTWTGFVLPSSHSLPASHSSSPSFLATALPRGHPLSPSTGTSCRAPR